ncbi:MAG: type II toxin-antitoxin system VapC family toxin [Acidobacteria bacterium]|nr:type II toxin-antitoxin system VapC family toxin [Acidobacteriota bacterium]MYH29283.1 type II toxin-antitoxin system VapC family toxin [Acidobacteriota bacterium]
MKVAVRFLLDTNIVSHVARFPQGEVATRIAEIGESHVCTSIVVASELRYGAVRKGSERLSRRIEAVLSALEVLAFEEPADRRYAELRVDLERRGAPIGPNDMLIAAQALAADLTVVTANVDEFRRVPALLVENWLGADA